MAGGKSKKAGSRNMIECMMCKIWKVGKFDDLAEEFEKGRLDCVGVVETQKRDKVRLVCEENKYQVIGKCRVKWQKKGEVGLSVKNALNWKLEETCVGNELESEDILVMRCEKVQANECIILVVCDMTTRGPLAQEGNVKNYTIPERVVQECNRFPVIVMGNMNGYVGILGEKVNKNGRKLIDFCEGNEFENLNITIGNGCTLSPFLFGLYTKELAVHLRMSGFELKVEEEKLSCLLYADDIVVVSESEQELQKMLEIVDDTVDFKVKFGGDKSKIMVINGDETEIGEVKIVGIKEYKYLGCMLSEDGCAKAKGEKVVKAM
ncbi:Reverse transcriptase domain [Trinorchestia longiramus]|nr:Reverse transcriptase domain [Trinorchestia longiramus]